MEDIPYSFGCSAITQDNGLADTGREKIFQGFAEALHVGVVTIEMRRARCPFYAHAVYRPDSGGFRTDVVKVGKDARFVGDGDIETAQIGMGVQQGRQSMDVFQFEGEVSGVQPLPPEQFVEIFRRAGMGDGVADDAVKPHDTSFMLSSVCSISPPNTLTRR